MTSMTTTSSDKETVVSMGKGLHTHHELTEGAVQEALKAVEKTAPPCTTVMSSEVSLGTTTVTTTASRERKPSRKIATDTIAAAAVRFKPTKEQQQRHRQSTGSSDIGPVWPHMNAKRVTAPSGKTWLTRVKSLLWCPAKCVC